MSVSWNGRKISRDHALLTDLVGALVMVNNSRAAAATGYSRADLNGQCAEHAFLSLYSNFNASDIYLLCSSHYCVAVIQNVY